MKERNQMGDWAYSGRDENVS